MRTCPGFGFPSLVWLFSPFRGLAAITLEEDVALMHSFVTIWLHGSLRSQLERRVDTGEVMRLDKP